MVSLATLPVGVLVGPEIVRAGSDRIFLNWPDAKWTEKRLLGRVRPERLVEAGDPGLGAIRCSADELPQSRDLRVSIEAHLAADAPQEVAGGPVQLGAAEVNLPTALAHSEDRPSIGHRTVHSSYARQEPDEVAGRSRSAPGPTGTRRPCRHWSNALNSLFLVQVEIRDRSLKL